MNTVSSLHLSLTHAVSSGVRYSVFGQKVLGGTNTDQRRFGDEPSSKIGAGVSFLVGNVVIFIMDSYNVVLGFN